MSEKVYWAALAHIPMLGGKSITRLLSHFGTLGAIFDADISELVAIRGIGPETAARIHRTDLAATEKAVKQYREQGIQLISWDEPAYPAPLLKTDDAPALLFLKGEYHIEDHKAIAVIGTRSPSPESTRIASHITTSLSQRGYTIISGLAYGIDTAAHRAAIDNSGRTLAVLGGGLRRIYPASNQSLADRICQQGALIAEVPPERSVSPQNLAARNRITSGLSRAVLIIQSEDDSGSLITARHAFRQRRPIFTIASSAEAGPALSELNAIHLSADSFDCDQFEMMIGQQWAQPPARPAMLPGFEEAGSSEDQP